MSIESNLRSRPAHRLLTLGVLLLALVAGIGPHTGHDASASIGEALDRVQVQPGACHRNLGDHFEAAGPEHLSHPCGACLQALHGVGIEHAAARLCALTAAALKLTPAVVLPSPSAYSSASSRAPPLA